MQIGSYLCHKVTLTNEGGTVVNRNFFNEKLFPKDIYITNVRFESVIVPCARFYKQPSCKGSNVKNGLKVKQLAKQSSTLKTLIQKILVGL